MQAGTGGRKHSTMSGGERRKQRRYDLRPEDRHSDRNLGPELHVPGEIVRTSTRPLKEQGGKASGPHLGTPRRAWQGLPEGVTSGLEWGHFTCRCWKPRPDVGPLFRWSGSTHSPL